MRVEYQGEPLDQDSGEDLLSRQSAASAGVD